MILYVKIMNQKNKYGTLTVQTGSNLGGNVWCVSRLIIKDKFLGTEILVFFFILTTEYSEFTIKTFNIFIN